MNSSFKIDVTRTPQPDKNVYGLLTEEGPEGTQGRDPRDIPTSELNSAGHHKRSPMSIIREKCMDCCAGNSAEVRRCTAVDCALWPYRMNKNVFTGRKGPAALKEADE